MNDDELLAALGALAQEEADADPCDARWDALAAGTLDPADQAVLAALAAEDPALADALAAFEPRDDAFDDAIAAAITAAVEPAPAPEVAEAPTEAQVIAFPQRRAALLAIPALVALAAGLFVMLRPPPPLPAYSVQGAGEQAMRGDTPTTDVVYGPGSTLDLVVRPEQDVGEAVALAVFVRVGDALRATPIAAQPSASGVFRVVGPVDDLLPAEPGPQTLLLVVGRPDRLPKSVDALRAGLKESPPPWQVLEHSYSRASAR